MGNIEACAREQIIDGEVHGNATIAIVRVEPSGFGCDYPIAGIIEHEEHITGLRLDQWIVALIGRLARQIAGKASSGTIVPEPARLGQIDRLDTKTEGRMFQKREDQRPSYAFYTGLELGATGFRASSSNCRRGLSFGTTCTVASDSARLQKTPFRSHERCDQGNGI